MSFRTYTYLPDTVYRQLRDAVSSLEMELDGPCEVKDACKGQCGTPTGATCWKVSGACQT